MAKSGQAKSKPNEKAGTAANVLIDKNLFMACFTSLDKNGASVLTVKCFLDSDYRCWRLSPMLEMHSELFNIIHLPQSLLRGWTKRALCPSP